MSLPEIRCVKECAAKAGYRRILIGLVVALTTFAGGVWLTDKLSHQEIDHSNFATKTVMLDVVGIPFSDGPVTHKYELFSTAEGAAEAFELQLREAGAYRGLQYCHNQDGKELGRQVLLIKPPARQGGTADWRIVWALRSENRSELFSVESDSLQQLQMVEHFSKPNWTICL